TQKEKHLKPAGVTTPGDVTGFEKNSHGLLVTTENSYIQMIVYTPSVIRVRMDQRPLGEDFSYAVVASPEKVDVSVTDHADGDRVVLATTKLEVVIHKHPFAVSFYTSDGRLINEDVRRMGTSWI